MAKVKAHKIREMTEEEVGMRLAELRESQFNLRFRNTMKQLDNPLEIRAVRREIAVLETALTEHRSGLRSLRGGGKSEG